MFPSVVVVCIQTIHLKFVMVFDCWLWWHSVWFFNRETVVFFGRNNFIGRLIIDTKLLHSLYCFSYCCIFDIFRSFKMIGGRCLWILYRCTSCDERPCDPGRRRRSLNRIRGYRFFLTENVESHSYSLSLWLITIINTNRLNMMNNRIIVTQKVIFFFLLHKITFVYCCFPQAVSNSNKFNIKPKTLSTLRSITTELYVISILIERLFQYKQLSVITTIKKITITENS